MPVTHQTAPSELALRSAASVDGRVKSRAAQVRREFVVASVPGEAPPLARLLRGGRGGNVRLRLYVSLLWFAANPPYDVTYPARAWASLLDLPDPGGAGARRVSDAIAWLSAHQFIDVQLVPGSPSRVVLLNELGTGRGYEVPGAAMRHVSPDLRSEHRYFQIPATFWTSGWLAALSGPAVSMLLVLLAETSTENTNGVWFSPRVATERFGLSAETRARGTKELSERGLIVIRKISADTRDPFEVQRTRNLYVLQRAAFSEAPRFTTAESVPSEAICKEGSDHI